MCLGSNRVDRLMRRKGGCGGCGGCYGVSRVANFVLALTGQRHKCINEYMGAYGHTHLLKHTNRQAARAQQTHSTHPSTSMSTKSLARCSLPPPGQRAAPRGRLHLAAWAGCPPQRHRAQPCQPRRPAHRGSCSISISSSSGTARDRAAPLQPPAPSRWSP